MTPYPAKRSSVPLGSLGEVSSSAIQVKALEGVFSQQQKEEIVERLTDTMVEIEGENMRQVTVCLFEEVGSGCWGIGGQTLTTDDAKALARGEAG
jgi:4-oxalocrotonate tautomerase